MVAGVSEASCRPPDRQWKRVTTLKGSQSSRKKVDLRDPFRSSYDSPSRFRGSAKNADTPATVCDPFGVGGAQASRLSMSAHA
ncbi:MAG: hypothetical protein QOH21_3115 [Acidobacteriota bacterium]|jgi:hypothetical protein|nr:hypothetical protein [Acidobacteriota bacterium]